MLVIREFCGMDRPVNWSGPWMFDRQHGRWERRGAFADDGSPIRIGLRLSDDDEEQAAS